MPRENRVEKQARARTIIARLKKTYPHAATALRYDSTWHLLVAVILSAQSTDISVNHVTPVLFRRFPTVENFAGAEENDIAEIIRPVGLARGKARSIKRAAQQIIHEFGGEVPHTLDELITLAGVGRKTASVVLGEAYGTAEGIVVDTHVARLSQRLGLTSKREPRGIEEDLVNVVPQRDWIIFSHLLIVHGRAICKARRPECGACVVNRYCPSAFKV